MKTFLASYVSSVIILFLFLFFFGAYIFDGRHLYSSLLLVALVPALIIYLFYRQSEEIDELRSRLDALEGKNTAEREKD